MATELGNSALKHIDPIWINQESIKNFNKKLQHSQNEFINFNIWMVFYFRQIGFED